MSECEVIPAVSTDGLWESPWMALSRECQPRKAMLEEASCKIYLFLNKCKKYRHSLLYVSVYCMLVAFVLFRLFDVEGVDFPMFKGTHVAESNQGTKDTSLEVRPVIGQTRVPC